MAEIIKGVDGGLYRAGRLLLRVNSWTLNVANGVENVTDFGSDGVERLHTGVADFTGSVAGQFPLTDTSTGGTTVASQQQAIADLSAVGSTIAAALWKLKETSKSMWFGTMLVTDWSKTNSAEGLQQFTANLAANGRLTYSSNTST